MEIYAQAPPGWGTKRLKRCEERGGNRSNAPRAPPLSGESPQKGAATAVEPLPLPQSQKQPSVLQLAVEQQTQGQHRKAIAASQRAIANRTAAVNRYMTMAAAADVQHSQPVQPATLAPMAPGLALAAGEQSQAAPAHGNWLLQSMNVAVQKPAVQKPPAPQSPVTSRSGKQQKRKETCATSEGAPVFGTEHRQSARTGRVLVQPRRFENCFAE